MLRNTLAGSKTVVSTSRDDTVSVMKSGWSNLATSLSLIPVNIIKWEGLLGFDSPFPLNITPSTQSKLFPILIRFFLIPKEIPFGKTIFGNFCELGRAGSLIKTEFPSQVVSKTYSILFSAKLGPFSNPFRSRASAVHDESERAE